MDNARDEIKETGTNLCECVWLGEGDREMKWRG
jgi:hypothetical protein